MKIQGPGGPSRPPEAEPVEGAKPKTAESSFAEKLLRAGGPEPAGPAAAAASEARAADPVSAVAAELRAGAITPRQAVDRLLDLAVSSAGGSLPEKVRARIRADLEDLLRNDPALASRARRVGVREEGGDEG